MRREIKATGIRKRVDLSIEQIAKWINPKLNGWINYYGRYTCSELYSVFRYINKALVRWGVRNIKCSADTRQEPQNFWKKWRSEVHSCLPTGV
ncbi:hypothetical protein O5466_16190 [Escherichia coli]|nr:hypothetical protein [Escherichia coli]